MTHSTRCLCIDVCVCVIHIRGTSVGESCGLYIPMTIVVVITYNDVLLASQEMSAQLILHMCTMTVTDPSIDNKCRRPTRFYSLIPFEYLKPESHRVSWNFALLVFCYTCRFYWRDQPHHPQRLHCTWWNPLVTDNDEDWSYWTFAPALII